MLDVPQSAPLYAVAHFVAHATIDKRRRLVTLDHFAVERAEYTPPARNDDADAALARDLPALVSTVALDRLLVELAAEHARIVDRTPRLGAETPRIIVAAAPAVLVLVDGAPVWRRAGERFDRLLNTRALVLADRARRWLYLYVGDTWYRARSLAGDWRTATLLPAGIDRARAALAERGLVDLLDQPGSALARALASGRVPRIFVASAPAELVRVDGAPTLEPIAGTSLSFVANGDADLFRDGDDGQWYLAVSGRWLRARALDGAWQPVAPGELPADFAHIPPEHDEARVLAAVPGSELAAEALADNEVPETATLRRADAHLDVTYDGEPRFVPLQGTLLRYAVNSATPVVELTAPLGGDGLYYALADGVWFAAAAPAGPWRVAASLPGVIGEIPASAPLHFASYAHVYGADQERVRVGYTPGYLGACRRADGVVVFGTGFAYPPYVGNVWIGRPATYGFRARYEPGLGWTLDGDAGRARATLRPWWPPLAGVVAGRDAPTFAGARADLYARWADAVVAPAPTDVGFAVARGGDELFAGADGRIYRARGAGWERYAPAGWEARDRRDARGVGRRRRRARRARHARARAPGAPRRPGALGSLPRGGGGGAVTARAQRNERCRSPSVVWSMRTSPLRG